jgi:acetolactate synthase-1/2/3 large subunit
MTKNGATILIEFLERRGVSIVAGMPGGANLPIYDALTRSSIRHILVRHEQAAGFIAQGMARVTGRAGVCFATSGPGATNLVTALADARLDSVPLVAITGQVPTHLLGTDAFQEVDTVGIVRPIVKHAVLVGRVEELEPALAHAFALAEGGRPGPVLVDIPKDVQQAVCAQDAEPQRARVTAVQPSPELDPEVLARIGRLLREAQRPVLYVGGGVTNAGAHEALATLAQKQQIPVTSTLMGLGCFDPDSSLALGMLGMHAAPYTNLVLRETDLLLAVGVRFDDRATGKLSEFCPGAKVVHADIDAREIGKLRAVDVGVVCDAQQFLQGLSERMPARTRPEWHARVAELRALHPWPTEANTQQAPLPLLQHLAARLEPDTVVTTDVGQHQMWVAQRLPFRRPRQLLTSGGLGSMGFGLPAAIGAALATRRRVWCITGDGSLLLNVHELATLAELDVDVAVIVLDNGHLGLVRQQQALFYGNRVSAARFERPTDFVAIARGFGLQACSLGDTSNPLGALDAALARRGPLLVHAPIDPHELVLPMVPPGAGNHQMVLNGRPVETLADGI